MLGPFGCVSQSWRPNKSFFERSKADCHMMFIFSYVVSFSMGFGAVLRRKNRLFLAKTAQLPAWHPQPGLQSLSMWLKLWIWEGHMSMQKTRAQSSGSGKSEKHAYST